MTATLALAISNTSVWWICLFQSQCHTYGGHSSHVTNVSFLCDDTRLLSTGGKDMAILQWQILWISTTFCVRFQTNCRWLHVRLYCVILCNENILFCCGRFVSVSRLTEMCGFCLILLRNSAA